jgi:hypothetical protein
LFKENQRQWAQLKLNLVQSQIKLPIEKRPGIKNVKDPFKNNRFNKALGSIKVVKD